jgi:hypothetical protein
VLEGTNDPAMLSQLTAGAILAENLTYSKMAYFYPARTKIETNGRFTFTGLRLGQFRFELGSQGQGLSILRVEHNGAELRGNLEVKAGEQVNNVRVVVGVATGLVRGVVNLIGGLLPNDAQVRIELRRATVNQVLRVAEMDSNKRFVLPGLADGEYEVIARLLNRNTNTVISTSQPQRIRVTNGTTQDVTIMLSVR